MIATMPKPAMAPTTIPATAPPESPASSGVSFCLGGGVADATVDDVLETRPLEVVALLDAAGEGLLAKVEIEVRLAADDLCDCNEALDEEADEGSESFSDSVRFPHSESRAWVH
jgi:hypothetical protein